MEIDCGGVLAESAGAGRSNPGDAFFGYGEADRILERLDSKKQRAAGNLGIAVADVESLPFDLTQLENEGIFLDVDCRGFAALERQIEWKSLGIELPAERKVSLSPPRVGLLPDIYRRKLLRAASRAHAALAHYGFRFTICETVWGTSDFKWVPWSAFESFESEFNAAVTALGEAKTEILENYDEILVTLQAAFAELADDSAKRLASTLETPLDREQFTTAVVGRAMRMVPTPAAIRDAMSIVMKPRIIVLGSEIEAEIAATKSLKLERERLDAEANAQKRRLSDEEEDRRREIEVKERIRVLRVEAAREAAAEAVSPIREGLGQITARVAEAAAEMAEKLQTSDFVPGSLAKRARQMCEWYELMNFTGDKSLEEVLARLRTVAQRGAKLRSREEMQNALGEVLRATSFQSKRLLDDDRLDALEI